MTDTNAVDSEHDEAANTRKKDKTPAEIWLMVRWCKGCGICVDYCKPGAIVMDGVTPISPDPALCTRCRMCEAVCPDFAIEIDPIASKGIREKGTKL